jgi:hypothetical protein
MTDSTSAERLASIRARAQARTPGEWTAISAGHHYIHSDPTYPNIIVAMIDMHRPADAAFIASAPADIEYLLARVDEQAKWIVELERDFAAYLYGRYGVLDAPPAAPTPSDGETDA